MIFILCLDGATFDLLDPWIEQGYLPGLETLIRSGVRSELQSTQPPVTAPAWASFMTGKSPGGHGVFDFFRQDTDEIDLVNSGLEDTMVTSYEAIRETYLSREGIDTLRIGALVVAIDKIATTYMQLGVFP